MREADLRYGLVHVRNNAESIAFFGGEEREKQNIQNRLHQAILNFRNLITWQKNLSYFTYGYQYLIQVLPLAIMAPLYFADEIKFGVVTQAGGVFATVLASLTLIVTRIESLSQFAAGITRLKTFKSALDRSSRPAKPTSVKRPIGDLQAASSTHISHHEQPAATEQKRSTRVNGSSKTQIELIEAPTLAFRNVTIYTPKRERILLLDTSMEVRQGSGMIIQGPSGSGKSSILRVFCGLWRIGEGTVWPALVRSLFLATTTLYDSGHIAGSASIPSCSPECLGPRPRKRTENSQLRRLDGQGWRTGHCHALGRNAVTWGAATPDLCTVGISKAKIRHAR